MCSHNRLASQLENSVSLDEIDDEVVLLGALIMDVMPNVGGIKGSLYASWKHLGRFKITYLHKNVFTIKAPKDKANAILHGGPWHVDNQRFIVVKWLQNLTLRDVHPTKAWYWVRIYGLSKEKMNVQNAITIGSAIGEVLETEDLSPVDASLRGYIRVKVLLDSRDSLPTGFWMDLNEYTKSRVEYVYEDLGDFYWRCGRLGHHMDSCEDMRLIGPDDEEPEHQ